MRAGTQDEISKPNSELNLPFPVDKPSPFPRGRLPLRPNGERSYKACAWLYRLNQVLWFNKALSPIKHSRAGARSHIDQVPFTVGKPSALARG
jgi:hypothetical protein